MTTGRVHEHLDIFEAEIEPKLKIRRQSGGRTFRILGHFWLAFLVLETTRGVVYFVHGTWESFVQITSSSCWKWSSQCTLFQTCFVPHHRTMAAAAAAADSRRDVVRLAGAGLLEGAESLARISEHELEKSEEQRTEEGIEALVEAAEEEGIIEPEQAD